MYRLPYLYSLPQPTGISSFRECISFMQLFTTDVYLNAFLSELKQIGLDYTVLERRPIRVASVADYRK